MSAGDGAGGLIKGVLQATNDWPADGLILAAKRLHEQCFHHLKEVIKELTLPASLGVRVNVGTGRDVDGHTPPGYVPFDTNAWVELEAQTDPTRTRPLRQAHGVGIAAPLTDAPELLVVPSYDADPLEVWRREVDPVVTTSLRLRLETWARQAANYFVQELNDAVSER
jgi:hypothetical protein